jgi:hypothetical protein
VGGGTGAGSQIDLWFEEDAAIVEATLRSKPKGMTQWSCRLMAARQGVSKSNINNIWQSHNLKPHRVKTVKLSRDPVVRSSGSLAKREFLATWNENPKLFVWTATVESIVQKLSHCRQTLEQIRHGCTLPRERKAKS